MSSYSAIDNPVPALPEGEFEPSELLGHLTERNNISFFLGAGFSMSWNEDYPAGAKLFSITEQEANKLHYSFVSLAESLGIKWLDESEPDSEKVMNVFRDLKYQIDIYKKYPSLLPSYLDEFTIHKIEKEFSKYVRKELEKMVGSEEFSLDWDESKHSDTQKDIFAFFKLLKDAEAPSFITTNYDFVIDRLIHNAEISQHPVRGVFSKDAFEQKNWQPCSDECQLLKINGGFEIFHSGTEYGFSADYKKAENSDEIPKLIVPSREQNYSDEYFRSVFLKACTKLRESDLLVFIGYSLPEEDYILRFLLSTFLDTPKSDNKEIYIIDYGKDNAKERADKVKLLFPQLDEDKIMFYNGTFQTFCSEITSDKK